MICNHQILKISLKMCMFSHTFEITNLRIIVHQPSPLPLQAYSLLCWCLFLSFLSSTLFPFFSPLPSHLLAFHSHVMFYLSLSSISHPLPPLFFWFCLVSFLWPPGDLCPVNPFAPLATCALWLPPADVAHHRAQHALNKPSNPKTPQGTILSVPYLPLPLFPVNANHCRPLPKPPQRSN